MYDKVTSYMLTQAPLLYTEADWSSGGVAQGQKCPEATKHQLQHSMGNPILTL